MESEAYKLMYELEEKHWWYRGLRDLLFSSIQNAFRERRNINILDAGCGTGFALGGLNSYGASFGIDISETALRYCHERGLNRIARASVSALPFSDGSFDLVVSTDVLYHKAVEDDDQAIGEIYRVLRKEGLLIVNLPAHEYLKRGHDEAVHTRHRYTKAELCHKLRKSKFKIIKISYRNAFSYFILLILKLVSNKIAKEGNTGLKKMWHPVNSALYFFLKAENLLLKIADIPFGTSIFCISKK